MSDSLSKKIKEAATYLRENGVKDPEIVIILGTGLNNYADRIKGAITIPYTDIPYFNTGKAEGHRGELIYGEHQGKKVICLAGRFHYYECNSMEKTAFPSRVMVELNVGRFIITNASGCVNMTYKAGQLMVISDHINLSGNNPLIGENLDEYGLRFPDMTYTYDRELREKLLKEAANQGIDLVEGVYTMVSGPSFETPAEIRYIRNIGGDCVGMSSVPEAIIANHAGKEIIEISFLSNMAAGVLDKPLSGAEVTEAAKGIEKDFAQIVDIAIEI
ncbi:MAG: purine-nucleoside phosphorylase [Clostridiales bacterium]|nr:purine-nucleoside phosphorylase [Clostridiales bacterium]